MKLHQTQRGSLLIVAVVMVVVIGFLGSAVSFLAVSQVSSNVNQARASQALFIAESGLERGIRQWSLSPGTYTGEGPLVFGDGDFTISVNTTDALGNSLPANQRRITSSGRVATQGGNAVRVTEVIAQLGAGGFNDPFNDISGWPGSGPRGRDNFNQSCPPRVDNTRRASNDGTVSHDPGENAPGSSGGALRAEVDGRARNADLTGYREAALSPPYGPGSALTLDFWYKKIQLRSRPREMMMAVDLVASDGTVYRLWSECNRRDIPWTNVSLNWTVPAGKTIDGIRLGYHILMRGRGRRATNAVLFDEVSLSGPGGGTTSAVTWREVVP